MARRFHVQGTPDGGIKFKTDTGGALFRQFLRENPGIHLIITPNEQISSKMRRFFEGAVVPYFALQHPVRTRDGWIQMSDEDARECLKREFNPTHVRLLSGALETVGGSTASMNRAQFSAFLERIMAWFIDNGYEFPDNMAYTQWSDSAPPPGEEYPGLKRLKEECAKKLYKLNRRVK